MNVILNLTEEEARSILNEIERQEEAAGEAPDLEPVKNKLLNQKSKFLPYPNNGGEL